MNAQQTRVRMEQPVWTTSTRQHVSVLRGGPAAPANQVGFFTKTLIWNSAGVLLVPGGVQINKNVEAHTIGMAQTLVLLMLMIFSPGATSVRETVLLMSNLNGLFTGLFDKTQFKADNLEQHTLHQATKSSLN